MKFLDILMSGDYLDCDLIVGDCEMPATLVWNEDSTITDYGKEFYSKLLNSNATILENGNIEVDCEDDNLGTHFVLAAAGYISVAEYKRLFECDPKDTLLKLIKLYDDRINQIEICRIEDHSKECIGRIHLLHVIVDEDSGTYGNYNIYIDTVGSKWIGDSGDFGQGVLVCLNDDEMPPSMYEEFIGVLRRNYNEFKNKESTFIKYANWVGSFINESTM